MYDIAYNVLFVDSFNSTSSLMAERLLDSMACGRFKAFSAGSHPGRRVHPLTSDTLRDMGVSADGLRCKSINEFFGASSPEMDFVFTLGSNALPPPRRAWQGQPLVANWQVPDPAAVDRDEASARLAFKSAAFAIKRRIELMLALPSSELEALTASSGADGIGLR